MSSRCLAIGLGVACLWATPDVYWGRLRFQVAPPSPFLQAEVEWHFRGYVGDVMAWDLGGGLEILQLVASEGIDTFWRDTAQRKVYVRFSTPLDGSSAWIRVRYEGIPQGSGFGSYTVQQHATGWCVWTLSQPYGAPDWLFCRDGLADKVDSVDTVILTPDTLLGVANGRLVADTVDGQGWRHRHFRHRYPVAVYLIAFAASNYVVQEYPVVTPYHTFILRNYIYPQDTGRAREHSLRFLPYFSWLEERLGPYPFATEDYQQVQIGWGGGMEHQTITFFGSYSLELWAHELAHQWFGDWVTCGSWQDIWLNEGFATYLGGAVYEALVPELWPVWRRLAIKAAWRDTVRTIWVEDTSSVSRIFNYFTTYAKGAVALHALREYIGEEAFWQGLRSYLQAYAGGFARTGDFVSAVAPYFGPETARAFVEGWIYTPHFPQAVFVWEGDQVCEVLYPTPYPVRVPFRKRYVSGRESQSELDMGSPRQRDTSPEEILSVEVDPDTLTPYWGPRYSYPLSVRGRVGPNPFTQYLYINIAGLREVRLYDATGRLVGSSFPSSREVPLSWELPFLPAGVYWLWVEGDGGVRTFPLVREP